MPFVNIRITNEGATAEQKQQLIKGVTDLLADVLGKNLRPHSSSLMKWRPTTGASAASR